MKANVCRGCDEPLPEPFLDLGEQPLANALLARAEDALRQPRHRLAVARCPSCHLAQLTDEVPPEELFSDYVYFSSYSATFLEHARAMADSLSERYGLGPSSRVVEVASNDGYLLQYFRERGIPVLGVEPAANVAEVARSRGVPSMVAFFGPALVERVHREFGAADVLIGNNVLAHVPRVVDFLRAARDVLTPNGVAVFEFPHIQELIEHLEFDTVYHEHVFYFSLTAIEGLARRAELEVVDVEPQPVHGGSLRVSLQRAGGRTRSPAVDAVLAEEKRRGLLEAATYEAFARRVATLRDDLRRLLGEHKAAGHRIAAYGAPAKGNVLLNYCGVGADVLDFTVDKNPVKQGKFLPGTSVPIRAVDELLRAQPDVTLILPWNIAGEIVAQQREYVAAGGKFLLPLPTPREVTS